MNIKQAIEQRKSIRKYKDKSIPDEIINELLEAARLAPSGSNKQSSRYRIIKDKETIEKLKENKIFTQDFAYTAPVIIVCAYDKNDIPEQKNIEYGTDQIIRCVRCLSIASSFIVLRAQELDLGTCYIGWMDKQKIKEILKFNDNIEVLFVITIGYPDEEGKPRSRKDINEILI